MSERNQRDRGALVALRLMLAAIVLAALIGAWTRHEVEQSIEQPYTNTQDASDNYSGPAEGHWWPEVAARDTYAQWAMSILALAATVISLIGIRLLRSTFQETKRTADAAIAAANAATEANVFARESAERETRAYLTVRGTGKGLTVGATGNDYT